MRKLTCRKLAELAPLGYVWGEQMVIYQRARFAILTDAKLAGIDAAEALAEVDRIARTGTCTWIDAAQYVRAKIARGQMPIMDDPVRDHD
jgi:hypothetical protein